LDESFSVLVEWRGCGLFCCILFLGPVVDWSALEWRVLGSRRLGVLELLEGFYNISRHGEVDLVIAVVPVQRNIDVTFSSPIRSYLVVLFEGVLEVESMLGANVLDAEVVNDKGELYWAMIMLPETGDELALVVTVLVESLLEELVGEETGLW
jgi:hypothetical protein